MPVIRTEHIDGVIILPVTPVYRFDEFIYRLTYTIAVVRYAILFHGSHLIAEITLAIWYCCIWLQSIYIVRLGTSSKYLCSWAVDRISSTIPRSFRKQILSHSAWHGPPQEGPPYVTRIRYLTFTIPYALMFWWLGISDFYPILPASTGAESGALINVVAHVWGLAEPFTILPQTLNRWHYIV